MPVTNYISVNGRILSEITDGVILDYVPDALGSIHSVVDQTATAVKTMRYKPYGEVLSRSGSISDRMYQWVGTYGYRATFNYASSHYIRARHYSQTPGAWTTVDPVWPRQKAYGYVKARITARKDYLGLWLDEGGYIDGKTAPGWKAAETTPYPNIGGGLKFDNCLHLDWPLPLRIGVVEEINLGLDICVDVYDTSCCRPRATATRCTSVTGKIGATFASPVPLNIFDLEDDAEQIYRSVITLLTSSLNAGLGTIPQKGCPQAGTFFDECKICVEACGGFLSVEGCVGTNGFAFNTKIGWCGFPQITIQFQCGLKQCV